MLDYISKKLQERVGTDDTAVQEEAQMNEAVLECCHLFQELDDLTMQGTEADSSRPFTKIDIPLENDIEIDTVELNLLDGRVTDIPTDATVQEHSVLYNRMKTYDEFYAEAYDAMTPFMRETSAQFEHRVHGVADKRFAEYKAHLIQEGLFGFDKVEINDKSVPAKITLDFGKMGEKDGHYYVKLPIKYEVDKKHRILLKQLHSIHWIQNDDDIVKNFTQQVYNFLAEKAGVKDESELWNAITPVEIVVPIDPADQYCVAIGFEIDGSEKIEYIEWMAPVKGNKKPEEPGKLIDLSEIKKLNAVTKAKAVQEMAVPVRKPSRFFQEEIDFGNPDEAPASDPNATSVSFDAPAADGAEQPAADAGTADAGAPPAEGGDATAAPADGTENKETVDTNDVSAEIADKISDDTQNTDSGDINVDDVNMDATAAADVDTSDASSVDDELNSIGDEEGASAEDESGADVSNLDFDNMTVEELLSQGSEKLKGMTIQQLRDFLNSPDGTPPPASSEEATQEAFFITRGNVGKELDIHLRKTLGILNNNDMDINELCDAFRKAGKQLNRVAHKASKMKKVFNETEIKQLQRLNACLSDLLSMMRADIDSNSVMTVKRMIQAFVSEATGVARMLEKKNDPGKPVQEGFLDIFKRKKTPPTQQVPDTTQTVSSDDAFKTKMKFWDTITNYVMDHIPEELNSDMRVMDESHYYKLDCGQDSPAILIHFEFDDWGEYYADAVREDPDYIADSMEEVIEKFKENPLQVIRIASCESENEADHYEGKVLFRMDTGEVIITELISFDFTSKKYQDIVFKSWSEFKSKLTKTDEKYPH